MGFAGGFAMIITEMQRVQAVCGVMAMVESRRVGGVARVGVESLIVLVFGSPPRRLT